MAEYRLRGGAVLTDEDFERMAAEAERGEYPGSPGAWVVRPQGRPASDGEPLVNVTVRFPRSMVAAVDARGGSRSDFIRRAVAAAL